MIPWLADLETVWSPSQAEDDAAPQITSWLFPRLPRGRKVLNSSSQRWSESRVA